MCILSLRIQEICSPNPVLFSSQDLLPYIMLWLKVSNINLSNKEQRFTNLPLVLCENTAIFKTAITQHYKNTSSNSLLKSDEGKPSFMGTNGYKPSPLPTPKTHRSWVSFTLSKYSLCHGVLINSFSFCIHCSSRDYGKLTTTNLTFSAKKSCCHFYRRLNCSELG